MSDDVVWHLVKNGFCAFRKTTDAKSFCTNMYNSTGLCNSSSCPLANSNYATVIEEQGSLMLCLKTAERSHTPRDQWERIKLSKSKREALDQISQETKVGFPSHQTLKCKLRFKRLREVLSRMRNAILNKKTRVVPIKKKTERREAIRERKAEIAAKLDKSIEDELLNRLSQGVYGELYNFDTVEEVEPEETQLVKKRVRQRIEYEREDTSERQVYKN